MKNYILFLTSIIIALSITSCNKMNDSYKNDIILDSGQIHIQLTENGRLIFIGCFNQDTLNDTFKINIDDDKNDILTTLQDNFNTSQEVFNSLDILRTDIEVIDFERNNNLASITIEYSDFEIMLLDWYKTLKEMSDAFGGYTTLVDTYNFITYKDEEAVNVDDLVIFDDDFTIRLFGGDHGVYYEFPYEIMLVDKAMDYEQINDKTIFVEDHQYISVVINGSIDGEHLENFTSHIFDSDILPISEPNEIPRPSTYNDNLELGQRHKCYKPDGSLEVTVYMHIEDISDYFESDFTKSESAIADDIVTYYKNYYNYPIIITNFSKRDDGIYYSFFVEKASDFEYYIATTVDEIISLYADFNDFFNYYTFKLVETGNNLSQEDLDEYGDNRIYYIDGGSYGTYYTLPGNITLADYESIKTVELNTVYLEGWTSGIIAIDN